MTYTYTYPKNKTLFLKSSVVSQPGITIKTYEWIVNSLVVLNSIQDQTINTNDLSIGLNTISLRVLNSCGSWSEPSIKTVYIVEEGTQMKQTITVTVQHPVEDVTIVMNYVGTINLTVTVGVNPVQGATIDLDGVPTGLVTGVDGKVAIPNVPYGIHVIDVTK